MTQQATLYGLTNTNRSPEKFWGKNEFNSSFPVALCCYMRDQGINPVSLSLTKGLDFEVHENTSMSEVFGIAGKSPQSEIKFNFEHVFQPYADIVVGKLEGIDLVTTAGSDYLRPLEVKLTVIPDVSTASSPPELWGSELVIRPNTTAYAALSIFEEVNKRQAEAGLSIVKPVASRIDDWGNKAEVLSNKAAILNCLETYLSEFHALQRPFLIQPIWKTEGQAPLLADNCFDVFVWTDYLLFRHSIIQSRERIEKTEITRAMRECVRLLWTLYELHRQGEVNLEKVRTKTPHGKQTDKAFALSGKEVNTYMKQSHRQLKPILTKNSLKAIILNGGEKLLKPERRFDATIAYTCGKLFRQSD